MMVPMIYKCTCMAEEVTIKIPERREGEDVVSWLENIAFPAIGLDHRERSPDCKSSTMEYVRIPLPENAPRLGGAPKMDS